MSTSSARSTEELAAAMYGPLPTGDAAAACPAPAASEAEAVTGAQPTSAAERMYGKAAEVKEELPAAVAELRAADMARRMYDDTTSFGSALAPVFESADLDFATKTAELKAWAGVFADHDLAPDEASDLVRIAQGNAFPDEGTLKTWEGEARSGLRAAYGDGAEQALADAKLLVQRDPRLQNWLNQTGLGSHPEIVSRIAKVAKRQLGIGKFRRN